MLGFLCFLSAFVVCAYGQTDCSNLPDGHYNIGCKVYDECKNHVLTNIECTMNMVYNNKTKACDYQNHVDPPCGLVRDCSKQADGAYTDYTLNCTSYFTCSHHVYYGHNFCTPGTVFEQSMGTCVWPDDAYKPCGNKV